MRTEKASQPQTHPPRSGADIWWWGIAILAFVLGMIGGSAFTAWSISADTTMQITDDATEAVPVVDIGGIRNGALTGRIRGNVLLTAAGTPVIPDGSGSFAIRDSSVLTNVVSVDIPDGMRFVASRRGKKYYPVGSADAQRIVPENRVYFPDEAAARSAGFTR